MSFNIGVIGTGYVGLVSGTSFAATGNNVLCVDIDEEKVQKMKKGISPIYEPGLDHLLGRNIKEGRLKFTTNLEDAVNNSEIIFLCLPTPPNEDGSADLQHVLKVAEDIATIIKDQNIDNHNQDQSCSKDVAVLQLAKSKAVARKLVTFARTLKHGLRVELVELFLV